MRAFKSLLGSKPEPAPAATFDAPARPDQTLCVIGDVHGCDRQLAQMIAGLESLGLAKERQIILVGDLIDRGEDSRGVIDRAIDLTQDAHVTCLMGNHERMLIDFLDDPANGARWIRNGGLQTLASFDLRGANETLSHDAASDLRARFIDALGPDRIAWLRAIPTSFVTGNVAVVHAAANPAKPISEQNEKALLWGHRDFHRQVRDDGVIVVHGHTIVQDVVLSNGRLGVDTGAYATGRLSGAVIHIDGAIDVVSV